MDNKKAISSIHTLLETCRDGKNGYQTAAENVKNPQVRAELQKFAAQREEFIQELESTALKYGESAKNETTVAGLAMDAAGAVHRGWINLKAAVSSHDSKAVLNECENGDQAALKTYESVMEEDIPSEIKNVVQRQHDQIEAAVNKIESIKRSWIRD